MTSISLAINEPKLCLFMCLSGIESIFYIVFQLHILHAPGLKIRVSVVRGFASLRDRLICVYSDTQRPLGTI